MDDLLRRADRAIEQSHRITAEAQEQQTRAMAVTAQFRATLQWINTGEPRYRQHGLETADWIAATLENPSGEKKHERLRLKR